MRTRPDDKVSHHQKVVDKTRLLDNTDFIVKPLNQLVIKIALRMIKVEAVMLFEPLLSQMAQILASIGKSLGNIVNREMQAGRFAIRKGQFHIASIGNLLRQIKALWLVGKKLFQLFARFKVEFIRTIAHALRIAHDGRSLDAEHDLMRLGMTAMEIVNVIRHHHAQPGPLRQLANARIAPLLFLHAMILHLEEEVVRPENIHVLARRFFSQIETSLLQRMVDFALQTG